MTPIPIVLEVPDWMSPTVVVLSARLALEHAFRAAFGAEIVVADPLATVRAAAGEAR